MRRAGARAGFSVLEILVAMLLFSLLALLANQLLMAVQRHLDVDDRAGERWARERFFVSQIAESATVEDVPFAMGQPGDVLLRLLTTRSARHGANGPLVIAEYAFDPGRDVVVYREVPAPAWWDREPAAWLAEVERRLRRSKTALDYWPNVTAAELRFIGDDGAYAVPARVAAPPPLVELALEERGEVRRVVARPGRRATIP
jgi:prepilin-type N-terminal cleavage/methylation domain-containing protein